MAVLRQRDLAEKAPLAFPYAPVELPQSVRSEAVHLAMQTMSSNPAATPRIGIAPLPVDRPLGRHTWVIAEGYIPAESTGPAPEMTSHETACILNPNDEPAQLKLMLYFADRDPVGPYRITVPPMRTLHLRFNNLEDPEPVPRDTDYASVFQSNVPVVIQHTRLDSRQPAHALLSTIAWSD